MIPVRKSSRFTQTRIVPDPPESVQKTDFLFFSSLSPQILLLHITYDYERMRLSYRNIAMSPRCSPIRLVRIWSRRKPPKNTPPIRPPKPISLGFFLICKMFFFFVFVFRSLTFTVYARRALVPVRPRFINGLTTFR